MAFKDRAKPTRIKLIDGLKNAKTLNAPGLTHGTFGYQIASSQCPARRGRLKQSFERLCNLGTLFD